MSSGERQITGGRLQQVRMRPPPPPSYLSKLGGGLAGGCGGPGGRLGGLGGGVGGLEGVGGGGFGCVWGGGGCQGGGAYARPTTTTCIPPKPLKSAWANPSQGVTLAPVKITTTAVDTPAHLHLQPLLHNNH